MAINLVVQNDNSETPIKTNSAVGDNKMVSVGPNSQSNTFTFEDGQSYVAQVSMGQDGSGTVGVAFFKQ